MDFSMNVPDRAIAAVPDALQGNQADLGAAQSELNMTGTSVAVFDGSQPTSLTALVQQAQQDSNTSGAPDKAPLALGSKTVPTAQPAAPKPVGEQSGQQPASFVPQKPRGQTKLPASSKTPVRLGSKISLTNVPVEVSAKKATAVDGDQATVLGPQPVKATGKAKGSTMRNLDRWTYVLTSGSGPPKQAAKKAQKAALPQLSKPGHKGTASFPQGPSTHQASGPNQRPVIDDDVADDGGEYVPGDEESEYDADRGLDEDGEDNSEQEPIAASNKTGRKGKNNVKNQPKKPKDSEEERSQQIEFVIKARDNNKPDPLGTHSIMTGKTPYSQVALEYNAAFNKDVTGAAIEKRYRLGKDKFCELHLEYPRDIIYATAKRRNMGAAASQKIKVTQDGQVEEMDEEEDELLDPLAFLTAEGIDEEKRKRLWRNGYGACKPPREVTEAADIQNYFNLQRPIEPREHEKWTTITALDVHHHPVGSVDIPTKDIRKSSLHYREYLQQVISIDIELIDVSRTTLNRYVDCISPNLRAKLPDYDFPLARFRQEDGSIQREPCVERINWTLGALVDLYCVAAELRDDHVRMLVLDHWLMLSQEVRMPEIDVEELSRLFRSTPYKDPARRFWVDYIYFYQATVVGVQWLRDYVTLENGWDYDFVRMMNARIDNPLLHPAWLENEDPEAPSFCSTYHIHPSDFEDCKEGCEHEPRINCELVAERILRAAQRDAPGELPDILKPSRARGADEQAIAVLADEFLRLVGDLDKQVDDGSLEDGDFEDRVDDNEPMNETLDVEMSDDSGDESLDERQDYDYSDEEEDDEDGKPRKTAQEILTETIESMFGHGGKGKDKGAGADNSNDKVSRKK
jgi:hypothetical protein